MIGGRACDVVAVVAVKNGHVRGGLVIPADGVEEGLFVVVEDVPRAAFLIDMEGSEGVGSSEHCGFRILYRSGMYECNVWSIGLQKSLRYIFTSTFAAEHHRISSGDGSWR